MFVPFLISLDVVTFFRVLLVVMMMRGVIVGTVIMITGTLVSVTFFVIASAVHFFGSRKDDVVCVVYSLDDTVVVDVAGRGNM
jgi:fatty-acid desaturase